MQKVILITGASSGFGEVIAQHLSSSGHLVYGTSRKIEQAGRPYRTLKMDIGDNASIQGAIATIIAEQGHIDVLINNAGLGIAGPLEHVDIRDIEKVFNTNIIGALRTTQAVLPHMRKQGSGRIINISSIGSENGLPYRGIYSASKAALDRLTEALRLEMAPFGIDACYVQPGGFNTNINNNRIITPLPPDSPYKGSWERCYAIIQDSVSKGLSPAILGPAIEKIIQTPKGKLKRCYRIGKPLEKLSVMLKHILPDGKFDRMLSNHYKV